MDGPAKAIAPHGTPKACLSWSYKMSWTVTIRPTCTRRACSPRASPDAPSCFTAPPTLRSAPLPAFTSERMASPGCDASVESTAAVA